MNFSTTGRVSGPTRRALVTGSICSAMLAGCANPALFVRNADAVAKQVFGGKRPALTRDQVAQFAAASVSVALGGGTPQLLLLTRVDGANHQWGLNGQMVLQTRGGRLTATGGFAHDLARTSELMPDPAQTGLLQAEDARCIRLLDYSDAYGTGCEAHSRFHVEGPETLEILGAHIATLRIAERVEVKTISWRHSNLFWVEQATGMVWRSQQHFHPDLAAMTITTMRPSNV